MQLKREEHKAVLKRAKELLSRPEPASTVVCAEDIPPILEALPEPSTSRQGTDLYKHPWWSLVHC